jgi:hypothetical protein
VYKDREWYDEMVETYAKPEMQQEPASSSTSTLLQPPLATSSAAAPLPDPLESLIKKRFDEDFDDDLLDADEDFDALGLIDEFFGGESGSGSGNGSKSNGVGEPKVTANQVELAADNGDKNEGNSGSTTTATTTTSSSSSSLMDVVDKGMDRVSAVSTDETMTTTMKGIQVEKKRRCKVVEKRRKLEGFVWISGRDVQMVRVADVE